jgi:AraC-like DNA-binding protein
MLRFSATVTSQRVGELDLSSSLTEQTNPMTGPISRIAWLLGFEEVSSFSHACRRWTGKSPQELRRLSQIS